MGSYVLTAIKACPEAYLPGRTHLRRVQFQVQRQATHFNSLGGATVPSTANYCHL